MEHTEESRAVPQTLPSAVHQIDTNAICPNARSVIERIHEAGYQAYLVGGCVRDLLLNRTPKDFDVATDAHPEQLMQIFEHRRLIGRRFQIVHVYFGRKFIEVSTFRAPIQQNAKQTHRHINNGRIIRDNVYGTIEQDAARRDFTVNSLFYNIQTDTVLDYCNGLEDIEAGVLRLIGDPETRYREDPVRKLRAIRFSAKLGLSIEPKSATPISDLSHLLRDIPAARLFDEVIKLFHSGAARTCYDLLNDYHLFRYLFPYTHESVGKQTDSPIHAFIYAALASTDARIAENKSVNPAFIYAVMLWPPMLDHRERLLEAGLSPADAAYEAANKAIIQQLPHIAIPKRFGTIIREIWSLQRRFQRRRGSKVLRFLEHPRFRAAYDFMCLRSEANESDDLDCEWWTTIQTVSPAQQKKMTRPSKRRK